MSRPPAVVMCVGPTGVGKTMLAKESAAILFGDKHFGRIDCTQLGERHGTSKLLGAPPGYVGYPGKAKDPEEAKKMDPSLFYRETMGLEAGGILLFDEIEKADPDVLDVLLSAFDEGYVKTSAGNVIDLRNVIIMVTSNLGARELSSARTKNALGFSTSPCEAKELGVGDVRGITMDAVKKWMKPELLSRISAVVPFMDLSRDEILQVVDLEMKKVGGAIAVKVPGEIVLSDKLRDLIADKSIERGSGARYVGRLVDAYVLDTLAEFYVEAPEVAGDVALIYLDVADDTGCDTVVINHRDGSFSHTVSAMIGE